MCLNVFPKRALCTAAVFRFPSRKLFTWGAVVVTPVLKSTCVQTHGLATRKREKERKGNWLGPHSRCRHQALNFLKHIFKVILIPILSSPVLYVSFCSHLHRSNLCHSRGNGDLCEVNLLQFPLNCLKYNTHFIVFRSLFFYHCHMCTLSINLSCSWSVQPQALSVEQPFKL